MDAIASDISKLLPFCIPLTVNPRDVPPVNLDPLIDEMRREAQSFPQKRRQLADAAVLKARQLEKQGLTKESTLFRELAITIRGMGIPLKLAGENKLVIVPEELVNG